MIRTLLFLIFLLLQSCSLFKKTTSTTTKDAQTTSSFRDYNLLNLKTANKETRTYTYWDSTGIYQYQNINEKIDQAVSAGIKTTEETKSRKDVTTKESKPSVLWIYAGVGLLIVGMCWLTRGR